MNHHSQHIDFARYTGRAYEGPRAFWQARQGAMEDPIRLASDRDSNPGEASHRLSDRAAAILAEISGGAELGRFVVLLAAIARVAAAEGGGAILHFDTPPLADAPHADEILPLVLPAMFTGTIRDLLSAARDAAVAAFTNQDFPIRRLAIPDLAPAPIMFASAALHAAHVAEDDRDATILLDAGRLKIRHRAGAEAAAALARRIDRVLAAFADTSGDVAEIDLLSDAERAAVLAWGAGPTASWQPASLWQLFRDTAARNPDRIALRSEGVSISYADLLGQATSLAGSLRQRHGIGPGMLVGLIPARRADWIVGLLGILGAGGAYLPLAADQPPDRLQAVLAEAQPSLLLSAARGTQLLADAHALPLAPAPLAPGIEAGPDDLAYVLYTSGSTGRPKGVQIQHAGFANMIRHQIEIFGIRPDDRVLQLAAASFDASLSEIFMALLAGATLVLIDDATIADPARFLAHLSREQVSAATITPAHLTALDRNRLEPLRILIMAGDTAVPEAARFYAADRIVFNAYGPTEVSVCASIHRVSADADDAIVPIGQTVADSAIYVLDPFGKPRPAGGAGEIVFAGPGVARGYLGQDSAAFIADPILPGRRAYRTGDRARFRSDGMLEFLGRIDRQVKIRGHRVEPAEIEHALLRHGLVREAHVAAAYAQDGQSDLAAYVCLRDPVELWPSIAEFFVYDELAYGAMANDRQRNASYQAAFARHLPDRVVLEIGPGAEAVLSRMAIAAGARKVYAVEISPVVADLARARLRAEGLADRIEIITGDIMTVMLPEKADICISEIVGGIGGSEGAAVLIEASRRWLKDPAAQIPARSLTRIAGLSLAALGQELAFPDIAASYAERIFTQVGRSFDLRLCLKHLPLEHIVTSFDVLEDLDYRAPLATASEHQIRLRVNQSGTIDALLVWLHLIVDADHPEEAVDILHSTASWLPVCFPLDAPSPDLRIGDEIVATVTRSLSANGLNPDFHIAGEYRRDGVALAHFSHQAWHAAPGFRETPLHRAAFAPDGAPVRAMAPLDRLRADLATSLPDWMVPAHIMKLDHLPLNASGKIDRKALPAPSRAQATIDAGPRDATEAVLAEIFAAVLGLDAIGVFDDFFALGGDSIRAIQVAARLGAVGISLASVDILQHRTIAALAPLASKRVSAHQGPVSGSFPLTPIQSWFFAQDPQSAHHFNQALLLRAAQRLDPAAVAAALDQLAAHHDSLRARFTHDGTAIRAEIAAEHPPIAVAVIDADATTLAAACAQVQASLDLADGPIFRAAILRLPDADRLLWVIHHLAVDIVSWRILLADLEQAYRGPTALPPRTDAFPDWARAVEAAAIAPWLDEERAWWTRLAQTANVSLPIADGPDQVADAETLSAHLPTEITEMLLAACNRVHGTETQDLLLAGLAQAVRHLTGPGTLAVLLEGHGREAALTPLDVSRTVGWFTLFHPVALDMIGTDLGAQIRAVRGAVRSVPRRGVGYLLLAGRDNAIPPITAQISFNYLGRFGAEDASGLFTLADEPAGPVTAPTARRPVPIEILTSVGDGRLHIGLTFNRRRIDPTAMGTLLDHYVQALTAIAATASGDASDLAELDLAGIGTAEVEDLLKDWG